tara:strand:+ start:208 stop:909 length:702 start_codon:yes stop_codon:yes gene_type:complete
MCVFFIAILILLFILWLLYLSTIKCECFSNNLTFTNTDSWGKEEYQLIDKITPLGKKLLLTIPNKSFPENLSNEANLEIQNIKKLQAQITNDIQNEIEHEIYLHGILDAFSVTPNERNKIIKVLNKEVDPVIMNLKKKYNRVRPYRLDKSIVPSIDPPMHPSYPSGHATQSFFIAFLLSNKYPEKYNYYYNIALKIAKNREYAGVHYSSDTKYGEIVAKNLFQHFSNENNPLL